MRRAMGATVRTGVALAVVLAAAASVHAQDPRVSISDDVRVVEGDSASVSFTVSLSYYPTPGPVTVHWRIVDGSAKAGSEYTGSPGGTLTFWNTDPQTVTVGLLDDTVDEWTATHMDEAFFVELYNLSTNAKFRRSRATVTIVDDDLTLPGLQFVSAVADAAGGAGRVRLQWRVPAVSTPGPVSDVLVRWTTGATCSVPGGEFYLSGLVPAIPVGFPGDTQVVERTNLLFDRYCYTLYAVYSGQGASGTLTTQVATVFATPLDPLTATGAAVAWAYSHAGSMPDLAPPTVGEKGIYVVTNDGVVHALARGLTGGVWPGGWNPVSLGKTAHNRSPVVRLPYGQRLFVGTESGEVHAVDGENGAIAWSRSARFGGALANSPSWVQATPAGLFTSAAGNNDLILVGTDAPPPNNKFHMLDPETGIDRSAPYSSTTMGSILGMAAVDYPRTAYFLTNSTTETLWALDLGDKDHPGFTLGTLPFPAPPLVNPVPINVGSICSPVIRKGRIYFGAGSNLVMYPGPDGYSRSASLMGDGEIKSFVFPDRRNDNLYFSTIGTASTKGTVWGFQDSASGLLTNLFYFNSLTSPAILSPSIVLYWPGTNFIYVGTGDGKLLQIELDPADWRHPKLPFKSVQLENSTTQIGAPSLDATYNLVLVGSVSGVVYAVHVPF